MTTREHALIARLDAISTLAENALTDASAGTACLGRTTRA